MMKFAWTGDLHLDFVNDSALSALIEEIRRLGPNALLLTGDTSEAPCLCSYLERLSVGLQIPLYFVLGNHDFYGSSIASVRSELRRRARQFPNVVYLSDLREPIPLGHGWALVGVDGWGDGRVGACRNFEVLLSDWSRIDDFRQVQAMFQIDTRLHLLHRLGDEEAFQLRGPLTLALRQGLDVIVATHVPPFAGAAWHQGKPSDELWTPWFVCKAVGDVLHEAARQFPARRIHVLCSHTHSAGLCQVEPNLVVRTSGIDYGMPGVEEVFDPAAASIWFSHCCY